MGSFCFTIDKEFSMKQYLDLLTHVLTNGVESDDRTNTGTIKTFGYQMRFDLSKGIPVVTTKKVPLKSVISELLWFIEGSPDERRLAEILYGTRDPEKRTIWTANYEKQGIDLGYTDNMLGPIYGVQWRSWKTNEIVDYENVNHVSKKQSIYENATVAENYIDQLELLIQGLKNNPNDRRHILTAWNVGELSKMALPPCHCFAQFFVQNGKLSCQLYQRSADVFLGVPFNITSYAIFTTMLAQVCGLAVGEFIWTGGDIHIYKNHIDQVKKQLERTPKQLPTIWINPDIKDINDFTMNDIKIEGYDPHPTIKAEMAA